MRLPAMGIGQIVLLVGVALTFFAMSQPFYMVKLPTAAFAQVGEMFADPTLKQYAAQAAAEAAKINAAGGVEASAWTAFERIDLAIAVLCGLAVVLVALRAAGHVSSEISGRAWLCGLGAVGLVAFRMVQPPFPAAAGDYVRLGHGAWMLLAATCLVTVGAWFAASRDSA